MQEDFLHYVWKHKKFSTPRLLTTDGELLTLVKVGQHNLNSGPDFFNAQLGIGGQLWAGNVEVHIKSSDWYVHNHERDAAYDNVILHVVYEHDTEIFRKDNTVIPTLELKKYISKDLLHNYQSLFSTQKKWINCENDFASTDDFVLQNWMENLYFERLERKSKAIETMLLLSKNDWEAVLFRLLAKNFGLKVNGEAFLSMASSFDFSIIRKSQSKVEQLEALFFGQAGMLDETIENAYHQQLTNDYKFLKQKYSLSNSNVIPAQFFRLRPPNFPTIRLSQLAMLYHQEQNLFSKIINAQSIEELYALMKVSTSDYWTEHYIFGKKSKSLKKTLTNSFIDLLIINTLLPLKFSYAKSLGKTIDDNILFIIQHIEAENNGIVSSFNSLKKVASTALESQSLIQLKTDYCSKNRCLQCAIGNALITKSQLENLNS
ncbi:DUF2851 family protein [Subsaxibacter sp. CAU 1640]|uniref:DUF2851 family protein n=1 Tax=Subsaxibacter sp. CAU 1640 TaxID=2933271 RepID=UPI002004328E|nr:DUF2851 family protein [Subsaxibacter sp. CAU 1640]MCK7590060.1 DUF2851 family protein [Subsaxibacter sp. CAU 1640]